MINEKRAKIKNVAKKILLFVFGIVIPAASFLLSSSLAPEAKSDANHDWASLLLQSKVLLSPLAIFAVIAFFTIQFLPKLSRRRWEIVGLWTGAFLALFSLGGLFLYDPALFALPATFFALLLELPAEPYFPSIWQIVGGIITILLFITLYFAAFYTPVWYGWLALRETRRHRRVSKIPVDLGLTLALSSPFVVGAIIWAQKIYRELPETTDCYVATAATTAHPRLVKNFSPSIPFPRQLIFLKAFELSWKHSDETSHRLFRRVYDAIGPACARLIRKHRILANATQILLYPAAYLAAYSVDKRFRDRDYS